MDQDTRDALESSIAKWKAIVDGTGSDLGTENCALCARFYGEDKGLPCNRCLGCPVLEKTGMHDCIHTPYEKWSSHMRFEHRTPSLSWRCIPGCDECLRLAKAELAFLEGLLPK